MDIEMSTMSNGYPASVASTSRPPAKHHGSGRPRSSHSSRTMSRNVRRLQEAVNTHLNNYEKELFLDALNEFHSQRDTWGFVEVLRTILNTPAKQQLVPMIRLVLPQTEIPEFDKCVQLSAAVARGDQAAGRITSNSASSTVGRAASATRTNSKAKYSTAPVRIRHTSQSPHRHRQSSAAPDDLSVIQISPEHDDRGIGFTTTSKSHHHHGIFVSSVDPRSQAFTQGLSVGDEILEANDIDLSRTTNHDATHILKAARSLTLTVRHCGARHSSVALRQETYTWVDTNGRSCSPPPSETDMNNTLRSSVSRRSGMTLISNQDERKINLRIERGHGLGLTIRGGSEYGLGIYITGVDDDSAARRSGIRVGDQVLAVNDAQFVEITHREAVKALKRSRHMMLTLKHVGKLPHAKIDKMKLLSSGSSSHSTLGGRRSRSHTRRHHTPSHDNEDSESQHRRRHRYPGSLDRRKYYETEPQQAPEPTSSTQLPKQEVPSSKELPVFSKGAGSQLMLSNNSTMMSSHNFNVVDDQARTLLNDNDRGTLKFYVDEYNKGYVSVEALVAALKELFNTQAKLFHDLRTLIHPRDLDKYDKLVVKYEVQYLKNRHDQSQDQMSDFSIDSILSVPSNSSTNESISLNLSSAAHQIAPNRPSHSATSTLQNGRGSVRSNKMFVTDGSNQAVVMDSEQLTSSLKRQPIVTSAEINHRTSSNEGSPRDNSKNVPRMGMRATQITSKPDGRSPSDDSGVDMRAKAMGSTNGSSQNETLNRLEAVKSAAVPDHTDSDSSSVAAVKDHYRQSYSLSVSDEVESEEDRIPGLHTDTEASDTENVVLVRSKEVGTLPRNNKFAPVPSSSHSQNTTPRTPTSFREQVHSRSVLTGKMYLPPQSQRQEVPVSDSDYDTADIINISKQLYASAQSENSPESSPNDATQVEEVLPPPPAHLLNHSGSSSQSTPKKQSQVQRSQSDSSTQSAAIDQLDGILSLEAELSSTTNDYETVDNRPVVENHPAVVKGKSPKSEKKKSDKSSSIYAVVKKQSPKHNNRPSMTFEPPPPVTESHVPPSIPTSPAQLPNEQEEITDMSSKTEQDDTTSIESLPRHEEVIRVNKLKSTLGLAIEGGAGTKQPIPRIINIQETGCAHNSGLQIGHVILRINDRYLKGLSHNQAARVIADAFRDRKMGYVDFLVTSSTNNQS